MPVRSGRMTAVCRLMKGKMHHPVKAHGIFLEKRTFKKFISSPGQSNTRWKPSFFFCSQLFESLG